MNRRQLLQKLTLSNYQNVAKSDFVNLMEGFGSACSELEGVIRFTAVPMWMKLSTSRTSKARPNLIRSGSFSGWWNGITSSWRKNHE